VRLAALENLDDDDDDDDDVMMWMSIEFGKLSERTSKFQP
jgi:hypothetical protein